MSNRYEGADGIRGLACLIVLCVHASVGFFNESAKALSGTGKIGVWLFFALSAFLLTSKFANSGFSTFGLMSYGAGRFLRIVPLFVVMVFLYFWLGTAGIDTWQDVNNAIFFKQGYGHLWTIPVEFKFYLLLPLMAYLLIKANQIGRHLGALGLTALMIFVQQCLWPYWLTVENSISTRWYLSSFTFGCYFAVSIDFYRRHITSRLATLIAVAVMAMMVLASPIMRNILLDMPMDKWLQNKFVYLSLLWGLFIAALADGKGIAGGMMKSAFMRKMGDWSYPIYLAHGFVLAKYSQMHPNSFVWLALGIASSVAVGAILHYLIEVPIERIRQKLQLQFKQQAPLAA